MWHYGASLPPGPRPQCRSAPCSTAGRPNRRRSKFTSTRRFISFGCGGSLKEARAFADKHGGWIAARLKRLPEAAPFAHGSELPLRGLRHRIVHRPNSRGTVWTDRDGNGARLLCVAGDRPHLARRVGEFLKREVKRD